MVCTPSPLRAISAIGQRRIIRPTALSTHQKSTSASMRNAAPHAIRRGIRDLRPFWDSLSVILIEIHLARSTYHMVEVLRGDFDDIVAAIERNA